MRRRDFITLGGASCGVALAARAQQPAKTFRIGVLVPVSYRDLLHILTAEKGSEQLAAPV